MGSGSSQHLLYGTRDLTLEECCAAVEDALGVAPFEAHESSFLGEYYRCGLPGAENLTIHANRDAEGVSLEPDFAAFPVLLYVNETPRAEEVRLRLANSVRALVELRADPA